jgi:hypothetical protein
VVALWTGSLPRSTYEASFVGPWAFSAVENRAVADYIAARTEPGDPILVYAFEPSIYYLSGRSSPTRHLSMAPITGEVQISPRLRGRWSAEQAIDCDRCPPRYIVLIALPSREIERQWEEHRTVVITAGRLRYTPVKGIGQFRILRLLDGEYNGRAVGGAAQ